MEEIVRKSRKDKYIASQKKEIRETSVERPERMPLQIIKNVKRVLSKLHQRRKKLNSNVYITLLYESLCISLYFKVYKNDCISEHTLIMTVVF